MSEREKKRERERKENGEEGEKLSSEGGSLAVETGRACDGGRRG